MTQAIGVSTRSIVIERQMQHPREKVWRALTEGPLIEQWLMKNDFQPIVGHKFNFRSKPMGGWNGVADCEVLIVEPPQRLSWSQNASGDQAADGLHSVVTWTLTPTGAGTHVRMEHSGFRPQDEGGRQAMKFGWPGVLASLERVAGKLNPAEVDQ
jgi:uncharacterized protein YndB with AHSA1/START domain